VAAEGKARFFSLIRDDCSLAQRGWGGERGEKGKGRISLSRGASSKAFCRVVETLVVSATCKCVQI